VQGTQIRNETEENIEFRPMKKKKEEREKKEEKNPETGSARARARSRSGLQFALVVGAQRKSPPRGERGESVDATTTSRA